MNDTETITRRFEGTTGTVHQTGQQLSRANGINVTLHFHSGVPFSAEVFSDDCSEYADLGLSFDGKALCDYDGAFELPKQVIELIREAGFTVDPEIYE